MKAILFSILLLIGISEGTTGMAQGLYFGGGLVYSDGNSYDVAYGTSKSDLSSGGISVILGQRFPASRGYWGWESNVDLGFGTQSNSEFTGESCNSGATGTYLCAKHLTARVVGVVGDSIGSGFGVFGTIGVGILQGDFASGRFSTHPGFVYGLTTSVGISHAVSNEWEARGEIIYDDFTKLGLPSDFAGASIRMSIVRWF